MTPFPNKLTVAEVRALIYLSGGVQFNPWQVWRDFWNLKHKKWNSGTTKTGSWIACCSSQNNVNDSTTLRLFPLLAEQLRGERWCGEEGKEVGGCSSHSSPWILQMLANEGKHGRLCVKMLWALSYVVPLTLHLLKFNHITTTKF